MVLPESASLCDAFEIAAIVLNKPLFEKDLANQFFPGQSFALVEPEVKDTLELAKSRYSAAQSIYPFAATSRSITFQQPATFNIYLFFLLGFALNFGGPRNVDTLLREFRRYFEDAVCWCLQKAGFAAKVLSEPRGSRGLSRQLAPALREISDHFKESAVLNPARLAPDDNDLDVDVLAVPIVGNSTRGGWPTFQIQCATGKLSLLQAKLDGGASTFATVWDSGFFRGSRIRAVATQYDLLKLAETHWGRLGQDGFVLDRTRLAHLSSGPQNMPVPNDVLRFWQKLWSARAKLDWETGWQQIS